MTHGSWQFCRSSRSLFTTAVLWGIATLIPPTVYAQSNWQSIGPNGGYFPRIVAHPSDSTIIFGCADDSGGIYRTTNGGTSWSLVSEEIENFGAFDIVFDPNDDDTLYATDLYGRTPVIKSTDGGSAWSDVSNDLPSRTIASCIAVDSTNSNRVFLGTGEGDGTKGSLGGGDGLYRSTNGGTNWSRVAFTGDSITDVEVDANGWVYAAVNNEGLYRSKNNGTSFSLVYNTSTNGGAPLAITLWVTDAMASPIEHDVWFAYPGSSHSIYRSTSNGDSGTYSGRGLSGYTFIWEITQWDEDTLYATVFGEGVKKTDNAGTSWPDVSSGLNEARTMLGITTATDADMFTSNYGNEGIYRSSNGGTSWANVNTGVKAYLATCLRFAPSDGNRIYVTSAAGYSDDASSLSHRSAYGTIGATSPYTVTWTEMDDIVGHATNIAVAPDDKTNIIVTTFALGYYFSTGSGTSGTTQYQFTDGCQTTWTMGAAFDPDNSNIAVVGGWPIQFNATTEEWESADTSGPDKRIYRTKNGGSTWTTYEVAFFAQDILAVEDPTYTHMWAATDVGVYISTNNGTSWTADTDLNNQLSGDDLFLNCIAQDPIDGDNLYVGSLTGEIWRTGDYGATWSQMSGPSGLADGAEVKRIVVDPDDNDWLYVAFNGSERRNSSDDQALSGGIYAVDLSNGGTTWYDLTTSALHNNMCMGMDFHVFGAKRMLYVGLYDASCFRIDLQ